MFRRGEQKARKRAINSVHKDICSLLRDLEGKLGFLLEDVLYMLLCCFKVDFQGGRSVLDVGCVMECSFLPIFTYILHIT